MLCTPSAVYPVVYIQCVPSHTVHAFPTSHWLSQNTQYGASEVKLFLETPPAGDKALPPLDNSKILLFFKQYDPATEALTYAGHAFASKHAKVASLFPMLRERGGLGDDEDVLVFEEVKFEPDVMCNQLEPLAQLGQMDLEHGDILCFQRAVPPKVLGSWVCVVIDAAQMVVKCVWTTCTVVAGRALSNGDRVPDVREEQGGDHIQAASRAHAQQGRR